MLCTKKRYRAFFYVTNSKKYEKNEKRVDKQKIFGGEALDVNLFRRPSQ